MGFKHSVDTAATSSNIDMRMRLCCSTFKIGSTKQGYKVNSQVAVNLFGIPVLAEQASQSPHSSHPDDLLRHSGVRRPSSLPVTLATPARRAIILYTHMHTSKRTQNTLFRLNLQAHFNYFYFSTSCTWVILTALSSYSQGNQTDRLACPSRQVLKKSFAARPSTF